ncbi:phage capsid family protein [Helicobacter sp. WB40]|uniref:phage capsid family protein n=1 Tax=Helicobacter sp. WB40 TaxID=3004130 RepID=UPI0022EBD2DD|nr:DUF4043 family protein [Helicobacter sp. WB40]MDA3966634.1 DUF4043 family protein [Helicobacter sp. WB40]
MADLNSIKLNEWRDDPNVAVNIAKHIEKASWEDSVWEPLIGKGEERGLRAYEVKGNALEPYRPRLKGALSGSGVVGNADFDTNYDKMTIYSLTTYPEVIGNALKSKHKLEHAITQIDFLKEGIDSLKNWMRDRRDKQIIASLSNDFTNCVVCDGTTGYKDTKDDADVQTSTRKIVRGDKLNVKAIRRAIYMAKRGIGFNGMPKFPIKPLKITKKTINGIQTRVYSYAILIDTIGAEQLRNDPEWIELQKMDKRGLDNNLFSGFIGVIDNCPVIDMNTWSDMQVGLLNSDVSESEFRANLNIKNVQKNKITPPHSYAGDQSVCIGALIGASSLVFVGQEKPTVYIDDTQDVGRKMVVGIDRIMTIAKARFINDEDVSSPYHDTDFATIGIFYSKED